MESLGRIAGIALVTCDAAGRPVDAAGVPALCRLVESTPEGADRCAADCGRHAALAREGNQTLPYCCHAGLSCFAAPVRVDGRAVASLLGGRTIERPPDADRIEELAAALALPADALRRAVGSLTLASARLLPRAAELVTVAAEAYFGGERRLQQARARIAALTSLLALGAEFTQERAPHEVCATVLDAAALLFDLDGACLLVRDERSGRYLLRTAFGSAERGLPQAGFAPESALLAPVLRARSPFLTDERSWIAQQGFRAASSLALFPLLSGERVLGVLAVLDTDLGREEADLLAAFCHQSALALQNALLRTELERRGLEISRAGRIRDRLAPLLEWDEVIEAVFEEAAGLAAARQASLMLLDRADGTLRVARASGAHASVLRAVAVPAGAGLAGRVAREGVPLLLEDVGREAQLGRPPRPRYRTPSCLVVPLKIEERVIGVINLADKAADAAFSAEDLDAVLALTTQASCALQRSALHRRTHQLRRLAATDSLTGLANRRYLEARLREEIGRVRRHGTGLALVMIDLDDFKSFNDRAGHPAGDRLLAAAARLIRRHARESDVVVRYGGEEFVVLCPEAGAEEAALLAERIRAAFVSNAFGLPGLPPRGGVSVSAGVAAVSEAVGDAEALVASADQALYAAKAAGKNRVARSAP